jgi:transcription elongation factor Elf1
MGLFGKKYKCTTCGASFGSEAELMAHSRIHMQKPAPASAAFSCKACGISFQTESELKRHSQNVHGM